MPSMVLAIPRGSGSRERFPSCGLTLWTLYTLLESVQAPPEVFQQSGQGFPCIFPRYPVFSFLAPLDCHTLVVPERGAQIFRCNALHLQTATPQDSRAAEAKSPQPWDLRSDPWRNWEAEATEKAAAPEASAKAAADRELRRREVCSTGASLWAPEEPSLWQQWIH